MIRFSPAPRMFVTVVVMILAGCRPPEGERNAAGGHAQGALTMEVLKRSTYGGFRMQTQPVTLLDGRWEGESSVEGGASRPSIVLATEFMLTGDIDGNGTPEAAVLLAENRGGTGEYVYVAVVTHGGDSARNIATALLGDRVRIRRGEIRNQRVLLDVLQTGPGDAMCCPGELATRGWELQSGRLTEIDIGAAKSRLGLAALGDGEWKLTHWDHETPAPAQPPVTFSYGKGHFTGHSGCNRYSLEVTDGAGPGEISPGAATATRMTCSDSAMAVEGRFLDLLGHVSRVGFLNGRCSMTYEREGKVGSLLFEHRSPAGPR